MVVMQMLMLNMLMAIIMDVYTEVKGEAAAFAPVWTQLHDIAMETWRTSRGERVPNAELIAALNELPQEEEVNEEVLCRIVGPGLSKEQSKDLIDKARDAVDHKLNEGVTMSEAMRMIGSVKLTVQKIGSVLEDILREELEEQATIQGNARGGPDDRPMQRPSLIANSDIEETSPGIPEDLITSASALGIVPAAEKTAYVADAADRMGAVDTRLQKIENFMQESLQYTTFRGKACLAHLRHAHSLSHGIAQRIRAILKVPEENFEA
jgi:hypothetical protein